MNYKLSSSFPFAAIVCLMMTLVGFQKTIQLDGVISDGEWTGAQEHELVGGGKLLIKKQGHQLYAAIVANKKGWAHTYTVHNDTVKVMHASAALGEAKYVRQGQLWRVISTFQWQLRERTYNDELTKKQEEHYHQHGWVANNNNMGDGKVFEFRFDLSKMDNTPSSLACVMAEIPLDLHYFPGPLADDTILPRLVQGYTPDSLQFDPAKWEKIK